MPSIRFRLDQPQLTGLADRIRREYGPQARILDAEEHVIGGMNGFFGRRVVDVTVELPDPVAPDGAHAFDLPQRVGIMALLDDADAADDAPRAPAPPAVSTERGEFASVLDGLRIDVEAASGAGGTPARPLRQRAGRRTAAAAPVPPQAPDAPSRRARHALPAEPQGPVAGALTAAAAAPGPDPRVALTAPVDRPATRSALRAARRQAASASVQESPPPAAPVAALEALPAGPPPAIAAWLTEAAVVPVPAPPIVDAPVHRHAELAVRRREPSVQAMAQVEWATPAPRSRVGRTPPGVAPEARRGAGDLLLLVGHGDDAVGVANAVRDRLRTGYVCDGGVIEGNTRRRVDDRRGALAARAYGVRSDQPVIVAYGLEGGGVPTGLLEIESDQAWLVVDAAVDAEETLRWVDGLRGRLQIDAIAGLHAGGGASPAIERIALPLAWTDRSLPAARIPA